MMNLHGCPRCNGAVTMSGSSSDSDMCINCGWRRPAIPNDVMEVVEVGAQRRPGGIRVDRVIPQPRFPVGCSPDHRAVCVRV